MTRTATIISIIVVIVAAAGVWLFMQPGFSGQAGNENQQQSGKISAETDAAIRDAVTGFGSHLKNVSLLATSTLSTQLQTEYGQYLSPDLLASWQQNPGLAWGREVSSPWPDRIEVATVTPNGDGTYAVSADIIEKTSTDTATSSTDRVPVTLTVAQSGNAYVIVSAMKGATTTQTQ